MAAVIIGDPSAVGRGIGATDKFTDVDSGPRVPQLMRKAPSIMAVGHVLTYVNLVSFRFYLDCVSLFFLRLLNMKNQPD